jgi:hypothetical protein
MRRTFRPVNYSSRSLGKTTTISPHKRHTVGCFLSYRSVIARPVVLQGQARDVVGLCPILEAWQLRLAPVAHFTSSTSSPITSPRATLSTTALDPSLSRRLCANIARGKYILAYVHKDCTCPSTRPLPQVSSTAGRPCCDRTSSATPPPHLQGTTNNCCIAPVGYLLGVFRAPLLRVSRATGSLLAPSCLHLFHLWHSSPGTH